MTAIKLTDMDTGVQMDVPLADTPDFTGPHAAHKAGMAPANLSDTLIENGRLRKELAEARSEIAKLRSLLSCISVGVNRIKYAAQSIQLGIPGTRE